MKVNRSRERIRFLQIDVVAAQDKYIRAYVI